MDEILKFPKHWEEFDEVDYTGTKFYYNKWPVIKYYILSKDFEKYTICWNSGNVLTQCRIPEVHEYFQNGTYIKIEEPKYIIGFDPACEDGDYSVTYSIKNGIAEVVKQEKIKEKSPIFITEDDVPLYNQNDSCWWVDLEDYRCGEQNIIIKSMNTDKDFKYFSNENSALTYAYYLMIKKNNN